MIIKQVCILGGSGFVGQVLSNRLARDGVRMIIPTRRREPRRDNLILLPDTDLVEADIHNPGQLTRLFEGCDAVINLVGILNEKGRRGEGFRYAHVTLAEKIIDACQAAGVRRVLQMSALNADAGNGSSYYLKTKGEAEDLLHAAGTLKVTSFRPSVIFGPGDSFFNRFAGLLKITPFFFPLACPKARFAPVYVGDVAEVMARTLGDPGSVGRRFELCGPHEYTLQGLVQYTAHCLGIRRCIVPLNDLLSRMQAAVFDFVPGKPFSTDNYLSTKMPSVCSSCDWSEFAIQPTAVESLVPGYLAGHNWRSRYDDYRRHLE